ISNYLSRKIEVSGGVFFSQHKTINRIFKFKNRDLSGSKLNPDLSYDYYFDIISPRADSEVKNLRFDTKHILAFSQNPRKDFPAVFISNATLKSWMADNGEDLKLKSAVEEFVGNGNICFKKVKGGYETADPLNTYVTNQKAETVDDLDLIERHEMTASQIKEMAAWDQDIADQVIKDLGNKTFTAAKLTTPIESSSKKYEIYEYTGEVNEKEYNQIKGFEEGDEHNYFLAKVIVAGLQKGGRGKKFTLFAERLKGKLSDHYIYAHRGRYEGRFWRVGMYELLFDHQIRASEIGNQLARGLEWASKVIFRSEDSRVMQNIRADLDNGDVVITKDLSQVDVRMRGMDQLILDWNRVQEDADKLSNSFEVVRGESMPSGTPFRLTALIDANAGKMFTLLRQKITLPYKRVFREWILPELVKDLKGEDVFRFVGETEILDQLRELMVNSWYVQNLAAIGPHTKDIADAIKAEKMDELRQFDPVIENMKEVWKGVLPRLFITITGENSDAADNIQDMVQLMQLEQDPVRLAFLLDSVYKIRGIPVPPQPEEAPAETQLLQREGETPTETPKKREVRQPVIQ
ncbi:hypothetical protein KA005_56365, partial [bacterium]|nr:hypothetical protein [bacterium]